MVNEPQRKMDEYGPEDMAIPTWTLLQKTGGDWAKGLGGKPGQFHNSGSDEIADEINIIVIDILMGRAQWGDEISDAGPICASLDAKSNRSINDDDCTKCPYRLDAPWMSDATERRTKCCLNYTILGIDLSNHMPCILRAHGISALPVRQLISQLRLNRQLKGDYYRAIVNIMGQEKTSKYGSAFALHPKVSEFITDETRAEELKAESRKLLGTPIPLLEGQPEEERQPLGFTPEGDPFYSEEEREKLMAPSLAVKEATPAVKEAAPAKEAVAIATTAQGEKKEEKAKPVDLDF